MYDPILQKKRDRQRLENKFNSKDAEMQRLIQVLQEKEREHIEHMHRAQVEMYQKEIEDERNASNNIRMSQLL